VLKTLIAYGTRRGITAETASIIADILRDKFSHTIDVINVKKVKKEVNLDQYEAFIVGSSIAYDRWTKEAKKFLTNDFANKKVAFFVCSGNAGGAAKEKNIEEYEKFQNQYINDVIREHPHIKPIAIKAFGGRVRYFGINFLNNWDREAVIFWAEKLGELLSK
jgi:menaquinone-dependent protoporphyrinogen oxidase